MGAHRFTSSASRSAAAGHDRRSRARREATTGFAAAFHGQPAAAGQDELARRFAGGDDDARLETEFTWSPAGPRLPEALAHFGCAPWDRVEAGDHTMVVGQVILADSRDGDALGFFRSRFIAVPQPPESQPITAIDPNDPYELPYDSV